LGSIVAKLLVQGHGASHYSSWVHMLDCHCPGEWGQINHSRWFAQNVANSLTAVSVRCQAEQLHQRVRALKIPSDYIRITDGITPYNGESLLIHIIVSACREDGHVLKWCLLDLTPQGQTFDAHPERRLIPTDPGRQAPSSLLAFHGATRTIDKVHATEAFYGISLGDRRYRFAVHVGDGALEGPFGLGLGDLSAVRSGLPGNLGWGALDGFHAADKAGELADKIEMQVGGLVRQFHKVLSDVRCNFSYGNGKVVARSIAKKTQLALGAPTCPTFRQHAESRV